MEILVCIKQVPDDSVEVSLNKETGKAAIEKIAPIVNAFDGYALEMATRFKEANGGNITVVSVGPEKARDSLRSCCAVGANKAFLVNDEATKGADTYATAYTLSKAVAKIEEENGVKFDIIFCGKETTDFTSSQVGPMLAEILGLPQVTNIVELNPKDGGLEIKQETDEGYNLVDVATPCVVTVGKPSYDPRYPTMKNKMAARKVQIPDLTAADMGADASLMGGADAKVKCVKVYEPAKKEAGVKIKEKTVEETVAKAVGIMLDAKVF